MIRQVAQCCRKWIEQSQRMQARKQISPVVPVSAHG